MRTAPLFVASILLSAIAACGGAEPPARAPEPAPIASARPAAPTATAEKPATPPAPAEPAPLDAPSAAKAFFEAIDRHDAAALAKVADTPFNRASRYEAITKASFDGPAKPDAWPHLAEELRAFEGALTRDGKSARTVVALQAKTGGGWQVIGMRDLSEADKPPPPPQPIEAPGKLLTKPAQGSLQIELATPAPPVGTKAELSRQIDASVPLLGGGWIVIATTEVGKVDGKKVTLKVLEEKSVMKINGKKLDHFTPGVPIRLKFLPSS